MGYGDHSDLHDHGPAGYWDGREAEQKEYERARAIRQQRHRDKRKRRDDGAADPGSSPGSGENAGS